jgi:hypothetical protein
MSRVLIIIALLSTAPWPELAAASCVGYEDVNLTGTIVRQTYPGPPDYKSITRGDEPQVIWVLLLDRRICVFDSYPAYYEREIQLLMRVDQYEGYRNLLGKKVIATGELLDGRGRYEKRLVLATDEVTRTRVRPY